jgi:hypothetical protein
MHTAMTERCRLSFCADELCHLSERPVGYSDAPAGVRPVGRCVTTLVQYPSPRINLSIVVVQTFGHVVTVWR